MKDIVVKLLHQFPLKCSDIKIQYTITTFFPKIIQFLTLES